jgi:hypothetical protein
LVAQLVYLFFTAFSFLDSFPVIREEPKKSPLLAGFVSMYYQCFNRCASPCYLQGAAPWTPTLSA